MISNEELKEKITEAFRHVPYPGDDHLITNQSPFWHEQQELGQMLRGRPWTSLRLVDVHNTSATMLTPEAFHYYIPAYMLAVIDDYEDADVLPEYTFGWLDPVDTKIHPTDEWFARFFSLLGAEQRAAIGEYMRFLRMKFDDGYGGLDKVAERLIQFYGDEAR